MSAVATVVAMRGNDYHGPCGSAGMASDLTAEVESKSSLEQLVLLGVTELHRVGETPAQSPEIRQYCKEQLPGDETTVVGTIGEADVLRSLYRLEAENLVNEIDAERTSPVGKGRPAYDLAVDPETVYEGVDDDLTAGTRS